jgi:hypothetical protein
VISSGKISNSDSINEEQMAEVDEDELDEFQDCFET